MGIILIEEEELLDTCTYAHAYETHIDLICEYVAKTPSNIRFDNVSLLFEQSCENTVVLYFSLHGMKWKIEKLSGKKMREV